MSRIDHNATLAEKRKRRVRAKLFGSAERPRLTVFRSNRFMYLQVIDDAEGKTLAAATDQSKTVKKTGTKIESAKAIAKKLFDKIKKSKIEALVFDRGSYKYHGRVKAVVEELRELGIKV